MSKGRGGTSKLRRQKTTMKRVEEIQRGQKGQDTVWKELESTNRHERRRHAKAAKRYDAIHGEGEADRRLREAIAAQGGDSFAEAFVRRADREGAGDGTQGSVTGRISTELHAVDKTGFPQKDR